MPVGVDLRLRARLADERIVRRHGAVVAQTQRLADVVVERLRLHAQAVVIRSVRTELLRVAADAIAIADRDVEVLVLAEEDAAGEVAAGLPRVGDEDLLHVAEHVALEEAARDRQRRALSRRSSGTRRRPDGSARSRDGPRRSGGDRCLAAACRRWRGVGDVHTGFGASTPLRMMRSAPLLLGHEDRVRIGEGDAPRMEQPGRDRDDANLAALHVEDLRARVARRCRRGCWPRPAGCACCG